MFCPWLVLRKFVSFCYAMNLILCNNKKKGLSAPAQTSKLSLILRVSNDISTKKSNQHHMLKQGPANPVVEMRHLHSTETTRDQFLAVAPMVRDLGEWVACGCEYLPQQKKTKKGTDLISCENVSIERDFQWGIFSNTLWTPSYHKREHYQML